MLIDFIKSFWVLLILTIDTNLDLNEQNLLNGEISQPKLKVKVDIFEVNKGKIS